jgi:hypothetical protein
MAGNVLLYVLDEPLLKMKPVDFHYSPGALYLGFVRKYGFKNLLYQSILQILQRARHIHSSLFPDTQIAIGCAMPHHQDSRRGRPRHVTTLPFTIHSGDNQTGDNP